MLPQDSYVLFFVLVVSLALSSARAGLRTRLTSSRPTDDNARSIFRLDGDEHTTANAQIRFNHDDVGITRPDIAFPADHGDRCDEHGVLSESLVVDGWRILRFTARVGVGKVCYRQARDAVLGWNFHSKCGKKSMGIVSINASGFLGESEGLRNIARSKGYSRPRKSLLATFTELALPFVQIYVVNPVHTVYEKVDCWHRPSKCVYSCTSYATLRGHLLSGEERVLARMRSSGEVYVEIVSFSRAGPSVIGKIVWPFIGRVQKQFFMKEIDHLAKAAIRS